VLQLGDQLHLVPELRRALPRPLRQPLHGDLRAAGKLPLFVDFLHGTVGFSITFF
jgi:hypothetical protein